MSGRSKTRQTKSSAPPSSGGGGGGPEDSEAGAASPSPRLGRKEAEHKRRVVENQYYDELMTLLSMISEHTVMKKMDKVNTLREAVICIRLYYDLAQKQAGAPTPSLSDVAGKATKSPTTKSPSSLPSPAPATTTTAASTGSKEVPAGLIDHGEMLSFFLDAHDSFLMIVSNSGRILFTTELVTSLLGQMQTRLVGQNVYDYVHANHKSTIQGLFERGGSEGRRLPNSPLLGYPSAYFTAHFKLYTGETNCEQQYLPFICLSFLREWAETPAHFAPKKPGATSSESDEKKSCVIIIGKLPTSMTLMDLAVSTNEVNFEFEMRISRQGRIIDIDKHAVMVFGFSTSELIGTLFFEYVDPYHMADVGDSMAKFLSDGIGTTTPYRIRTKGGRCIWLISKGYLSYDPWNNKLNHILLANRVLGCDQVLPEHRFFKSTKLLPTQNSEERYVPDPNSHPQPPAASANSSSSSIPPSNQNHLRTRSQALSTTSFGSISHPPPSNPARVGADTFPHLSANGSGLAPVGEALSVARQVFNNNKRVREEGVANAQSSAEKKLKQEATNQTQEQQLQRELEEKSLKLLEMQKRLMEQEQQFNQDRMQFFRAAQTMMEELSKGVRGGGGGGGQPFSPISLNPATILDSMSKSLENVSSPSMTSSTHDLSAAQRGGQGQQRNFPTWGEGGGRGGTMNRMGSRTHLPQQQQQVTDHFMSTPSPVTPSTLGNGITPSQNHTYASYNNSPLTPSSGGPMLPQNMQMQPSPDDSRYHSPLSCLPYDCQPSLAEHNMQFFQQQQQQQQTHDNMFTVGGGVLHGNPPSTVGNARRDFSHMLSTTSSSNVGTLDLHDILNST